MKSITIYLFIYASLNTTAQTTAKWNFGVQAGLNSSWIRFNRHSASPGISPMAGMLTTLQIAKRFSLQTEVNYSLVKSKLNSKNYYSIDAYSEFKGLTTIHYAEWPILVSYSIIENEKLKFSSGVGNSFKYSLNGNIESPIFISLQ